MTQEEKVYLQQEFYKNNVRKYYKYFEQWFNNLTPTQIEYLKVYAKGKKTPLNE